MSDWISALAPVGRAFRMKKQFDEEARKRKQADEDRAWEMEIRDLKRQELQRMKLMEPQVRAFEELQRKFNQKKIERGLADLEPAVVPSVPVPMADANKMVTGAVGAAMGMPPAPAVAMTPEGKSPISRWADLASPEITDMTVGELKEQRNRQDIAEDKLRAMMEKMAYDNELKQAQIQARAEAQAELYRQRLEDGTMRNPATIGARGGSRAPRKSSLGDLEKPPKQKAVKRPSVSFNLWLQKKQARDPGLLGPQIYSEEQIKEADPEKWRELFLQYEREQSGEADDEMAKEDAIVKKFKAISDKANGGKQ